MQSNRFLHVLAVAVLPVVLIVTIILFFSCYAASGAVSGGPSSGGGGSGTVDYNGEVSRQTAGEIGWVYDRLSSTNRLRSIEAGYHMILTNENTNIVVAFNKSGPLELFSTLQVFGDITCREIAPEVPSFFSLGSSVNPWLTIFADTISIGNLEDSSIGGGGILNAASSTVGNFLQRGSTNLGASATVSLDFLGPEFLRWWPTADGTMSAINVPTNGAPTQQIEIEVLPNGAKRITWPGIFINEEGHNYFSPSHTNVYLAKWTGTNYTIRRKSPLLSEYTLAPLQRGSNLVCDGGMGLNWTLPLIGIAGGVTNIQTTNVPLGRTMALRIFPTNGVTPRLNQYAAADWNDGVIPRITSNVWTTVYSSKTSATETNNTASGGEHSLVAGITASLRTNEETRTISFNGPTNGLAFLESQFGLAFINEDFAGDASGSKFGREYWTQTLNATGEGRTAPGQPGIPFALESVNPASADRIGYYLGPSVAGLMPTGYVSITFLARVMVGNLSDGTDKQQAYYGFFTPFTSEPTSGIYIRQTNNVWEVVTARSSSYTFTSTGTNANAREWLWVGVTLENGTNAVALVGPETWALNRVITNQLNVPGDISLAAGFNYRKTAGPTTRMTNQIDKFLAFSRQ